MLISFIKSGQAIRFRKVRRRRRRTRTRTRKRRRKRRRRRRRRRRKMKMNAYVILYSVTYMRGLFQQKAKWIVLLSSNVSATIPTLCANYLSIIKVNALALSPTNVLQRISMTAQCTAHTPLTTTLPCHHHGYYGK